MTQVKVWLDSLIPADKQRYDGVQIDTLYGIKPNDSFNFILTKSTPNIKYLLIVSDTTFRVEKPEPHYVSRHIPSPKINDFNVMISGQNVMQCCVNINGENPPYANLDRFRDMGQGLFMDISDIEYVNKDDTEGQTYRSIIVRGTNNMPTDMTYTCYIIYDQKPFKNLFYQLFEK